VELAYLPTSSGVRGCVKRHPSFRLPSQSRLISDGRTKHIDIRWCYIQQQIIKGAINVSWIITNNQAADGLTKALDRVKFAIFRELIGMVDCTSAINGITT
jgi:hypothetical protein